MSTILLLIAVVFVVITLPAWPYSKSWGYRPTGTVLMVTFLIWSIFGNRPLVSRAGEDIRALDRDGADPVKVAVR